MAEKIYRINQEECIQCGTCADQCPAKAIWQGIKGIFDGKYRIVLAKCAGCGSCMDACPVGAIQQVEKIAKDDEDEKEFIFE